MPIIPYVATTLVVKLLLQDKGRWLFLAQTTQNGGKYSLVGGKVESEELATAALARESLEEADIYVQPEHLQLVFVLFQPKNKKNRTITLYFKASQWAGAAEAKEPKKFKRTDWFSAENLPKNISNATKFAFKNLLKGVAFAEWQEEKKAR